MNKPLVLDLVRGDYIARREKILIVGLSGTGITHLVLRQSSIDGWTLRSFWRATARVNVQWILAF